MEQDKHDYLFKFIIIGNTSTGKSCFLHYFLENKFKKNSTYTIGVEFGTRVIVQDDKSIKLQIWDTAGQERFKSVARTYYRGALGAIILYDITNMESFQCVEQWIKDAREMAKKEIAITVCGNKLDLKDRRMVQTQEAQKFCTEQNVNFIEASALTGENVNEAFTSITKDIMGLIDKGLIDKNELKPRLMYGQGNANTKQLKKETVEEKDKEKKKGCSGCSGFF